MNAIKLSELQLRMASGLILIAFALGAAYAGGLWYELFWSIAAFLCFWEWTIVSTGRFSLLQGVLAVGFLARLSHQPVPLDLPTIAVGGAILAAMVYISPTGRRIWPLVGLLYASLLAFGASAVRDTHSIGLAAILFLYAIVWVSDIAAYFVGRALGGPKLCPSISPKKTWSGFLGGVAGAAMAAALAIACAGLALHWQHVAIACGLSIVSAAGDLAESAFKRHFDVKDASRLIPGHGGVMDRLDGFIATLALALVIGCLRDTSPAGGLLTW